MAVQTGAPSTVQTSTNTTFAFSSGAQRADVIRDPNLGADQRTIERWFDTEAFRQNPIGVPFVPEDLAAAFEAGVPEEELLRRP